MKRKRDEGVVVNVNTPDNKRRKVATRTYTPKSSSMDIEPSTRPGYFTVARTRGPYARGEMKYFDAGLASTVIAGTTDWTGSEYDPATILTLCCPTQGAAINQRIGREISIHKIKVRGSILMTYTYNTALTTWASPAVRLILYVDNQTNSAQSQGEYVMSTPTAGGAWLSYQNIDMFGRFNVLKDKMINLPIYSSSFVDSTHYANAPSRVNFKFNINLKTPIKVRFNNTNGGTIADITDNSLHIIAAPTPTTPGVNLTYVSRVCYKDT